MRKDGQTVLPFSGWSSKHLCVLASLLLLFLVLSADVAAQIAFHSAAIVAIQPSISYVGAAENDKTVHMYRLTSTATYGAPATANYVERQLSATIAR